MYANTAISTGMKGATKAMTAMNRQMAPTKQAKVIKDFQKQSSQMDMTVSSTPYTSSTLFFLLCIYRSVSVAS
ncbi:hypothetical protein MKW94_010799 [Papaver nudicaule]|uniref:Uncharacterized protein n=1 Tax=Papaver nudicaule TaxID=74823 RepID=A0AA41VWZ3_PAPNU|nr:hypothetical protein [Papaver nudicaule]